MTNENYNCIIIDDEPKAIELLADSLNTVNKNIHIKSTYTSWADALNAIRSNEYDLIFLDISIQGRNGMDLLRAVPGLKSEVIFITAHSDHALDAFKFLTSGYLLKPINEVELATTIDRAISRIQYKKQAQYSTGSLMSTRIGIPDNKSINYIAIHDILYLEAWNTYTKVITTSGEILSAYNIGKFKDMLPEPCFYQVHRSFIVNLEHVSRYENVGNVILDNGKELPVAKSVRAQLLARFTQIRKAHP